VLQKHAVAGFREQRSHDVAAWPFRRFAGKGGRVAVPAVAVVVDIHDRYAGISRSCNCLCHPCAALAKRCEQRACVLVVEVVEDVDDEERIALPELGYAASILA
jgi:hypothetical protein